MNRAPYTYRPDRTIADADGVPLARCYADRNEAENGPLFAEAPAMREVLRLYRRGTYGNDSAAMREADAKAKAIFRRLGATAAVKEVA
jgi:hypothetical protein